MSESELCESCENSVLTAITCTGSVVASDWRESSRSEQYGSHGGYDSGIV